MNQRFGAYRDNLNDELQPFSDLLEFLIMKNLYCASKKTYGDNGLVIALDAKWGGGKTTFLKMFKDKILNPYEEGREKEYIHSYDFSKLDNISRCDTGRNYRITLDKDEKKKVIIIEYNALENDYFDDPFTSLVGQFCDQFEILNQKKLKTFKEKARKLAPLLTSLGSDIALNIASCIPIISELAKSTKETIKDTKKCFYNVANELKSRLFDEQLSKFKSLSKLRTEFKNSLNSLSGGQEEVIKLVFVDELDRCKPKFAVNFLEILKHFFNVENTVFILALDKSVLAENVKHCYGNIDGIYYLSRMFDFDFRLPTENKQFYEKLRNKYDIHMMDDQFANEIREFFVFSARDWIKYSMNIKHLQRIPTWNRREVYILLAVKMFNPKAYKQLCEFDIPLIEQESSQEPFQKFVEMIKPIKNDHSKISLKEIIGGNLYEEMYNLFINIANANQKGFIKLDKDKTLAKSDLIGIINAINYMF